METNSNTVAGSSATPPNEQRPANEPPKEGQRERVILQGKSFAQTIQASQMAARNDAGQRKYIEDLLRESERFGMQVESVVTGTVDAQVVYIREYRYGIALIFANTPGLSERPVADKSNEVIAAFHQHSGMESIRIIKCYVIDDSSYEYAGCCAASILNTIKTVVDENENVLNLDSFRINDRMVPMVVSTRPEVYRDYINRVSPFGFPLRDDIGFVVGFPRENCPPTKRFSISHETHIILFAVTAYTQFSRIDNPGSFGAMSPYAYGQPVKTQRTMIHISSIISTNPSMVLLPPAITIAAKAFISHDLWKRPYLQINGKEIRNVGNLILQQDPSTCVRSTVDVQTPLQAEEALNTACEAPILCLDLVNGRDGIPGLECILGMRDSTGKDISLASILQKFYGDMVIPAAFNIKPIACNPIVEYTGSIMLDNQVMDDRCADYLALLKRHNDFERISPFLSQPNDPAMRMQQLQDLGHTTKSLYNTTSVVLSRDCVQFMADLCPSYELDLSSDSRCNYNFSGLEAAAGVGNLNLPTYAGSNIGNGSYNGPLNRW